MLVAFNDAKLCESSLRIGVVFSSKTEGTVGRMWTSAVAALEGTSSSFVEFERILPDGDLNAVDILIFFDIAAVLSLTEIQALHSAISRGLKVLICIGSDSPRTVRENVNFFLEEYGLSVCVWCL